MADMIAFEIDAGKILAKMHRGGCETHPKMRFFNTGIIEDADLKPVECGTKSKITFDFDNGKGEYQVGVMPEPECVLQLKYSQEEIDAAEGEADQTAEGAEDEVDETSGIMDDAEDVDDRKEKAVAEDEEKAEEEAEDMKEEQQKSFEDML